MSSSSFTSPGREVVPATSSPLAGLEDDPIAISSDDDDVQGNGSHSSPYFTQPTQILSRPALKTATQPTQIVDRPRLGLGANINKSPSSSPQSDAIKVEVPASSPYQRSPLPSAFNRMLGGRMAPAGTSFRPPTKISAKPVPQSPVEREPVKRGFGKISDEELDTPTQYAADSSGDERPARGDIQRSSFQRQQPKPPSPPSASLHKQHASKQQLAKVFRELKSSSNTSPSSSIGSQPSAQPSSRSSEPSRTPSPPPKRRRLVRGRNPDNSPSSSQVTQQGPQLISLIDDDDDDDDPTSNDKDDGDNYVIDQQEESSEDESETESRSPGKAATSKSLVGTKRKDKIIQYLGVCSVESLMADAKIQRDAAKHMIDKRPFRTAEQVKAVMKFKISRGKKIRYDLGQEVFDELVEYMKRLDAIDRVVEYCDTQGNNMRIKIGSWKMDQMGKTKGPSDDKSSILPFSREPKAMRGHCTMQPYQLFGMNWMWQLYAQRFGGILADDMGLGKTCQVVSFIALLKDQYDSGSFKERPWPNLVVVPPSVLENWENEFDKFAPDLSIIKYSGKPGERDELALEIRDAPEEYHVILTSYSQMSRGRDVSVMNKIGINAAIFDEGHKLKNPNAQIYQDLIRIDAVWKLIMTGTPIQNNIMEMVSLLNFLSPNVFHHYSGHLQELFVQKASLQQVSEGAVLLSDRVKRARSILEPFILQRTKEQVLSNMPAKVRKAVYCDMDDGQKALYEDFVHKFRDAKTHKARSGGRKNDLNNPWIQLRKAAIHPQLFRRFFTDEKCEKMAKTLMKSVPQDILRQPDLTHLTTELKNESDFQLHLWCRDYPCIRNFDCPEDTWLESGKVQKLLELIGRYQNGDDRVLVFSRFAMVLSILEECLAQAGIRYLVLQGETKVAERQQLIDQFNDDKTITVFLLTTKAGGTGINLTAANKVILFDQSDNPQDDIQAENRAHRLGQQREVEVSRLLSKGTIDELIYKACQRKLELAAKITGHHEEITGAEVEAEVSKLLLQE
ncbi:DNA-dependent ATPase fun30 [Diaporthe australafricana]|uniref:DNA-dependent ATPase fun30 n=1 Tax=Diaporthe australafricana TaxID=127596 RepID=A0ABR3XSE7_9PEZI